MCGRFAQFRPGPELEAWFETTPEEHPLPSRYNIAPGSAIRAARLDGDGRRLLSALRWGLIPSWARDRNLGYRTINARAETVADKPTFRAAFRHRRCLIPADGFYEWQATDTGKQPYYIRRKDDQPLALAGLWEEWTDRASGETIHSGTIIVTDANALMRPIHDRMPVILAPEDHAFWLDPGTASRPALRALLRPCDPDALIAYPVSRRVNKATEDDPSLIEPL
ncbi:SOS response-associated peptidase [Thiocystis violacea]|uniref:SOS response-associated peptidase n=1 Tax=Thiocystis violacea TaxID=13725 RepID=UPI001903B342|nr:SOS response-associated peptidase [Thiocystis violacea]MBK1718674.1 hypothetical protein [Thiocystis violacea]